MNDTLRHALEAKNASRDFFLKHLKGITAEQWNFKPFTECKSAFETLQHLIVDDLAAIESLRTGAEPDYESHKPVEGSVDELLETLGTTHAQLLAEIEARFPDPEEGTPICIWGDHRPFRSGVAWLSSEDFYHAGQIAFIRIATDPEWNYYATVYGH